MLSNSSNTRRLEIKLAHDATEKAKERIASLRRDVYLEAAEEMVNANNHLAKITQLDPVKQNIADGLQGFFKGAAKLQLVCDLRTSALVGELVTLYGELLLRLIAKVQPIHDKQIEISITDTFYERERAEVTRVLTAMNKLNESGQPDANVFASLERSMKFHEGQLEKFGQERISAWESRNELHKIFVRELLTEMRAIGQAQIPVVVAIRRELELGGDANAFRDQMNANWKRIELSLDTALAHLQ